LACGAFGLLPFALVMLQQRVFYAMRDARTPTFINIAMVATKVVLVVTATYVLHGRSIIVALTVSTSLSYLVGCIVGHFLLRARFGGLGFRAVLEAVAWILVPAAAAAAAALVVVLGGNAVLGAGRLPALVELVVGGLLFLVVVALVAVRVPLPEVAEIRAAVQRVRGRSAAE
jgi:putative peptidoglycan lipid II flippase